RDRFAISFERKHPDVIFSFGIRRCVVQEKPPVVRPTCWGFAFAGLQEDVFVLYPACQLLIEVERTAPIRSKNDSTPIRRPDGAGGYGPGFKGESRIGAS